ncbi:MAG: hypothetical protein IPG18_18590 [Saprospiraceae bacterium]|nr:hypothetical protein [Saprospiraceae bacterium]
MIAAVSVGYVPAPPTVYVPKGSVVAIGYELGVVGGVDANGGFAVNPEAPNDGKEPTFAVPAPSCATI